MESKRTFLSLPMSQKLQFETSWKDKINKEANNTLKSTMKMNKSHYEPHTLLGSFIYLFIIKT